MKLNHEGVMLWLATVSATYGSSSVFSVHDDLLAFPQYEVVFSPNYILDTEAQRHDRHDTSRANLQDAQPDGSTSPDSHSELAAHGQQDHEPNDSDPSSPPKTSSYHTMTLKSRPYLCSIPTVVPPPTNTTETPKDPDAEAAELARATDRGWELLKDMEGNCMYFISGWWSYSFCYNTAVTQFHSLPPGKGAPLYPPTEDPTTPSYILGKFSPTPPPKKPQARLDSGSSPNPTDTDPSTPQLQAQSGVRYLVQKLHGGTTCDLTGRDRKVEVQFHCHPQSADRIGWIKEVSTCAYLMVIYTPRLCNDVAFLPPRENKANPITCREIIAEDAVPSYEARQKAERERKLVAANPAGRPVVAGIEVGAMKLVGKEGLRLEPPTQISPQGPHTGMKADLLARQDAPEKGGKEFRLSKAEIKKLGLEPKLVDEAVRELKQVAEGKAWKLEVFDAPTGERELRGIVEGDGETEAREGEVEFFVVADGEGEDGVEGGRRGDEGEFHVGENEQGGEGDDGEDGSEETFKDEL